MRSVLYQSTSPRVVKRNSIFDTVPYSPKPDPSFELDSSLSSRWTMIRNLRWKRSCKVASQVLYWMDATDLISRSESVRVKHITDNFLRNRIFIVHLCSCSMHRGILRIDPLSLTYAGTTYREQGLIIRVESFSGLETGEGIEYCTTLQSKKGISELILLRPN